MLARRVFADGRTRAYAWGRAIAREDAAAAAERLIAMSGQFEQRRLSRPSYQLDLLDAFAGEEQGRRRREARVAWRELLASRRRYAELTRDASAVQARLEELRALVEATDDLDPGSEERLRGERERISHVAELAQGAQEALEALAPEEGDGAAGLVAAAESALAPLERLAPELAACAEELRGAELELRETASSLSGFLASLEVEPDRLEQLEAELDRIAQAKRRFRCLDFAELMERADAARAELAQLDEGIDPLTTAEAEMNAAEERVQALAGELRTARQAAAEPFAASGGKRAGADRPRGGRVPRRAGRTRARPERRRRDRLPDPAQPRPSLRAGGRDRLGRRAVAHRAGAGGGGRRRDARLRRDRRRHRRSHGQHRRRHARAPRRAGSGDHDHAPAPDRQQGRHATSASRRSRAIRLIRASTRSGPDERKVEIERMLGGEEFLAVVASLDAS